MNIKVHIYFIMISIFFIAGCVPNPNVRFMEPQPINVKNLKTFPRQFRGQYLNKTDSSFLTINKRIIIQEWYGFSKVSEVEMKEEIDTIINNDVEFKFSGN